MARIDKSERNIYEVPRGTSTMKNGYVYLNIADKWKRRQGEKKSYSDHDKVCIGILVDPSNRAERRLYANAAYFKYVLREELPERPARADSVSVGLFTAMKKITEMVKLEGMLKDAFGEDEARLILDLAMYMISEETAVFQHFPHWARSHETFSGRIRSDSFISKFEANSLSPSKIKLFQNEWALSSLDDGRLYFCYDSTNVNSQAKGIFLVQKGHAKDDPGLDQVNVDYVIRQRDGMPVTFRAFPGSVVDVSQAEEIIRFVEGLLKEKPEGEGGGKISVTMICDRGYISEDNVSALENAGIDYLLMLRSDLKVAKNVLEKHGGEVESSKNYIREHDQYGITVENELFEDGKPKYFHVYWDAALERKNRASLRNAIDKKEKQILDGIKRKTKYSEDEIARMRRWFSLSVQQNGTIPMGKRGRGAKGDSVEKDAFCVMSCERDYEKIDREEALCGHFILVTSKRMSALDARNAYAKRDCVEKVFQSLKSFMGMDKIGVYSSDEAVQAKILVWFVASILHSVLFEKTGALRVINKKDFTVPSMIDFLEEIVADRDLSHKKYERRYALIKKQKDILNKLDLSVDDIDTHISKMAY